MEAENFEPKKHLPILIGAILVVVLLYFLSKRGSQAQVIQTGSGNASNVQLAQIAAAQQVANDQNRAQLFGGVLQLYGQNQANQLSASTAEDVARLQSEHDIQIANIGSSHDISLANIAANIQAQQTAAQLQVAQLGAAVQTQSILSGADVAKFQTSTQASTLTSLAAIQQEIADTAAWFQFRTAKRGYQAAQNIAETQADVQKQAINAQLDASNNRSMWAGLSGIFGSLFGGLGGLFGF